MAKRLHGLRDSRFELLLSAREKQRYGDAARKRGITLAEYIRRHVEEGWSLENALELQVEERGCRPRTGRSTSALVSKAEPAPLAGSPQLRSHAGSLGGHQSTALS